MILRQADVDPRACLQNGRVPEVSDTCSRSFVKVFLEMMLFLLTPVDRPPLYRDGGSGPCVSISCAFRLAADPFNTEREVRLVATRPGVGANSGGAS